MLSIYAYSTASPLLIMSVEVDIADIESRSAGRLILH